MRLKELFASTGYLNFKLRRSVISLITLNLFGFFTLNAQSVLTQHNDVMRTGWDAGETILTQANVSGGTFGKIFQINVDDQIYCQPLVVNNLSIPGKGSHNVLIIATVNNTVYAFDADDSTKAATPYWQVNLTYDPSNCRAVQNSDMYNTSTQSGACGVNPNDYQDFTSRIGIVGTPVIDGATNTMYLVARSVTNVGGEQGTYFQYLHALDLTTGNEKSFSPKLITASYNGTGDGNTGGVINFDPRIQNQRPSILLENGIIYIAWASHCDWLSYHGWVMGYSAADLSQQYVYNDTPDGQLGGIWMSGQGPSADAMGNVYVTTGNGTTGVLNGGVNDPNNPRNRASSMIKFTPNLSLTDFFTPVDYDSLNIYDLDYGVDGALLIPNTNLSLSGSKEGYLYLVDINNMGHTVASNSPPDLLQRLDVNATYSSSGTKHVHGSPVYFQDNNQKEYVYAWGENGIMKQFPLLMSSVDPADSSKFDLPNTISGNTTLPLGMPGAFLSVSSNGTAAGTGIVWASHPINGDANHGNVPGMIQALDATDISHELWNSNLLGNRDTLGLLAKFSAPTIANGKVYLATFSNNLKVYGLNAPIVNTCPANPLPSIWSSGDIGYLVNPGSVCYTTPNNGTYTITSAGADIYGNADAFYSVFQSASGNNMLLSAHVVSIDNTGPSNNAKVGVMFRSNLDPGSPNVFVAFNSGNNQVFSDRLTQSGQTVGGYAASLPGSWVELTGINNVYTGYSSTDGTNWIQVGSPVTINLGTNIYASLAYTSDDINNSGVAVVDNVTAQLGSIPLPVTLINFTASNKNNQYSLLNWETSAEVDFDHFEIEHSTALSNFGSIGTVPGHGDSQVDQLYSFTDQNPADGDNYYRLKLVDKDGKTSYSKVVKLVFNLSIITMYPNPAKDKVYLKNNFVFTGGEYMQIDLTNTLGQHLLTQSVKTEGMDQITINLPPGIKTGLYYLRATNSKGQKQNWKILIQN